MSKDNLMKTLVTSAFLFLLLCGSAHAQVQVPVVKSETGAPKAARPAIPVNEAGQFATGGTSVVTTPVVKDETGRPTLTTPVILVDPTGAYAAIATHPGYLTGQQRWYAAGLGMVKTGTVTGQNSMRAYPWYQPTTVAIDQLGTRVNTLDASGSFQLAIYASNPTTLWPTGLPVAATGNISEAATVTLGAAIIGAPKTLIGGKIYWGVINNNSVISNFMARDLQENNNSYLIGSTLINDLMGAGQLGTFYLSAPQTYGTWPDGSSVTWTPFFLAGQAAILFRVP